MRCQLTVRYDGQNIDNAIKGATIERDKGCTPRVVLDIVAVESVADAYDALVTIPESTAALLQRLGWTPPNEEG